MSQTRCWVLFTWITSSDPHPHPVRQVLYSYHHFIDVELEAYKVEFADQDCTTTQAGRIPIKQNTRPVSPKACAANNGRWATLESSRHSLQRNLIAGGNISCFEVNKPDFMLVLLLITYAISCFCFSSVSHYGLALKAEKHSHLRNV